MKKTHRGKATHTGHATSGQLLSVPPVDVDDKHAMSTMATKHHSPRKPRPIKRQRLSPRLSPVVILSTALLLISIFSLVSTPWLIASIERDISHSLWTSLGSRSVPSAYQKNSKPRDDFLLELEGKVAAQLKLKVSKVRSCGRHELVTHGGRITVEDACRQSRKNYELVLAYNPVSYERTLCGMKAPANGFVHVAKPCRKPPLVFHSNPTVDGKGMPAMHMIEDGRALSDGEPFPCDIRCEKAGQGSIKTWYAFPGTELRILFSMESAQYYSDLAINDSAYLDNHYYATTSLRSEIPLPYFSWAEYNISKKAVDYDKVIKGASFIAGNCASQSHREDLVRVLMNYTRVDALSSCLHNAERPEGVDVGGLQGKINLMRSYLFHLAFENSNEPDYITEKLWGTLQSGTLPVYYGAPNVNEHVPPNSIISWHDFNSSTDLALYLEKVAANKTLYESYHAWRSKPLAEWFRRKYNFTHTHSTCRMCRWAYAKKYGLGWDHENQKVQDLAISRRVKYDKDGAVVYPFREHWLSPGEELVWTRKLWEHDGVVDLHFESHKTSRTQVYRMETDVRGRFQKFESNHFVLQNDRSRVTILTSWDAAATNPQPGMMDITLEPTFDVLRLRVIIEDVDTFHIGADNVTNYFGNFMAKDFFSPIEFFLVEEANLTMDGVAAAA